MTSRERMLAAIARQQPDHVPLCFLRCQPLEGAYDRLGAVERLLELGLDARIKLPWPVEVKPSVEIREWKDTTSHPRYPLLHKEYHTAAGVLRTVVRQTADWETGDSVPLLSDLNVSRAVEHLVKGPQDLDKLRALLCYPGDLDLTPLHDEAAQVRSFAQQRQVLVEGWGGNGADMLAWLSGIEPIALAVMDEPDFVREYVDLIRQWDLAWIEVTLDWGADLLARRGWYETPPLWSPAQFQEFIAPMLKEEIDLAHQGGASICHLTSVGLDPVAPIMADLGLDVMFGVEPTQAKSDLRWLKQQVGHRLCFWGGVNAPVVIEKGTPQQVRAATRHALESLGPDGFILSSVDSVRDPGVHENVQAMIEEWRALA